MPNFLRGRPADPRGQRPPGAAAHAPEQDALACYYEVTMHGAIEYPAQGDDPAVTFLLFDYDVWERRADFQRGDPPAWRNSHLLQLSTKPTADHDAAVGAAIEHAIRHCSYRDGGGDERDRKWRRRADMDRVPEQARGWHRRQVERT